MATGDMKNNLRKLRSQLNLITYRDSPDYSRLMAGDPACFMEILYFTIFTYNPQIPSLLADKGYIIMGLRDEKFLNMLFKLMREKYNLRISLKTNQFFNKGFAERKIILTCEVIRIIRQNFRAKSPSTRCHAQQNSTISVVPAQNIHVTPPQPIEEEAIPMPRAPPVAVRHKTPEEIHTMLPQRTYVSETTEKNEVVSQHCHDQASPVDSAMESPDISILEEKINTLESEVELLKANHAAAIANHNQEMQRMQKLAENLRSELHQGKQKQETTMKTMLEEVETMKSMQAQIDVLSSRILVLESAAQRSPVCGAALSCKIKRMNLSDKETDDVCDKENNNLFLNTSNVDTDTSIDIGSDIRHRKALLQKSVQDTLDLFGPGKYNALESLKSAGVKIQGDNEQKEETSQDAILPEGKKVDSFPA